jgi:hypothetical protein
VLTIVHSCCILADSTRFITKFPAINLFGAVYLVAVVSAETELVNPVFMGGIAPVKVFQAGIVCPFWSKK